MSGIARCFRLLGLPLLLLFPLRTTALITTNLAASWSADAGIIASGGRISAWTDTHQSLNPDGAGPHLLFQTNASFQPYETSDPQGRRGVLFPWGTDGTHPHTFLNITNSLGGFGATNMTVYIVATGASSQENQSLIWFTGSGAGWIRFVQSAFNPSCLFVGSQGSPIYPPVNPAVFVGSCDGATTTLRWNNLSHSTNVQTVLTTTGGGTIGSGNGTEFYSGIIYQVLIYRAAHSPVQIDAQVAELAASCRVVTNYTKQVVCRGASTAAGMGSTMLQSFPFQLWQRYPDILWRIQSSQFVGTTQTGTIGTNGIVNSMYGVDGTFVDPLFDSRLQANWLFVVAGINDIHTDGLDGMATCQRLTNYVAARKASRPWKVAVSTVQATVLTPSHAEYNSCIRSTTGGWDALVDPGFNSPVESRLNNPGDSLYFIADGIHLTNRGYEVFADHFGMIINVPHRTTGFFGP